MASSLKVRCPKCRQFLSVPDGIWGASVRCACCKTPFRMPSRSSLMEEAVASWLHQEQDMLEEEVRELSAASSSGSGVAWASPVPAAVAPPVMDVAEAHLRVISLDSHGVLLEFSSERLKDPAFRAALPRRCVHCQGQMHLTPHLVIFSTQLRDSISLEAEHKAGHVDISAEQVAELSGLELLNHLPQVPNVPPPANLPMPYWVCDMCSGAGAISGQIQINSATARGACRLHLRNLKFASEFLVNAGAGESKQHAQIGGFLQHVEQDRWEALPTVVRHRLEQWYRPAVGERFLAYIPDRSFVRTEDGMAGLAISEVRIVYHRTPLHQEATRDLPLNLQARLRESKEQVAFQWGAYKQRLISLDRSGLLLLRRVLMEGKFKANWT